MKKTFRQAIVALCLMAVPMAASAQSLVFHLAGGEKTTIQLPATFTVTPDGDKLVVDAGSGNVVELAKDEVMCVTYRDAKGDVNGDQRVDVADVSTVVSLIIGAGGSSPYGNAPKNAEAVDLGLPSGTKWANMNVGAEKPEDYGLFFAWGETTGYSSANTTDGHDFDWSSYTLCNGTDVTLTKYNNNSSYGIVDNKTPLEATDDAAYVASSGEWRMPTYAEWNELLAAYPKSTTPGSKRRAWLAGYKNTGVAGLAFYDASDNILLFLPAAGCCDGTSLDFQGSLGFYWSSSLCESNARFARYLYFYSGYSDMFNNYRYFGFSVRPVLAQ